MNKIKPCYIEEIKRVSEKTSAIEGDFRLAAVTDTHLDNSLPDTIANIHNVDKNVNFDCLIHMGDFLNGNIPRKYTAEILKAQMDSFIEATASRKFYPAPGNHDGFTDKVFHRSNDMTIDEDWYEATKFTEDYENVTRIKNKQYFYADYPDKKIRLIVVNSYHYEGFTDGAPFKKVYGIDKEQIEWVGNVALNLGKDWTVIFLSHDMPFSDLYAENVMENNEIVNGNLMLETVIKARADKGFEIAAWFVGHHHGDCIKKAEGINFILVGSETAYRPQLWSTTGKIKFYDRFLNTDTEDLWDSIVVNLKEKKLHIIRFGVGDDRETTY